MDATATKTFTCTQMGGKCDASISGSTKEEVIAKGMEHLSSAHPEMAADMKTLPKEALDEWAATFDKTWDATPHDNAHQEQAAA